MAGSTYTSAVTTPTQSTTGTLKRSVSDTIRHLWPGNRMFSLISSGIMPKMENVIAEKGLIRKRRVMTPKYECFTYTPLAIEFTVSSKTSATVYVLSDATGLHLKNCLVNTRNRTVCRIQVISSNTITIVSIGDTTFDAAANDKLLALSSAYEENSDSPYILTKDYDNLYNFTQITREAIAISRSASGNPHYGGDYWNGLKKKHVVEVLRKAELSAFFSERASGTNETTADASLGAFRSTRGFVTWNTNEKDCGGAMTADRWITELSDWFDETVGVNNNLVAFCGTTFHGQMLQWVQDKMLVMHKDESLKKFGVNCSRFMTAKQPQGVRVIVHDAFDRGDLAKQMFFMDPELCEYVHLRDDDFKNKNGIQNNDVDGVKDEILGEWGVNPIDGGQHMLLLTNLY